MPFSSIAYSGGKLSKSQLYVVQHACRVGQAQYYGPTLRFCNRQAVPGYNADDASRHQQASTPLSFSVFRVWPSATVIRLLRTSVCEAGENSLLLVLFGFIQKDIRRFLSIQFFLTNYSACNILAVRCFVSIAVSSLSVGVYENHTCKSYINDFHHSIKIKLEQVPASSSHARVNSPLLRRLFWCNALNTIRRITMESY